MTHRPIPDSLLRPGLAPVWEAARRQLDRFGPRRRGTIVRPELDSRSTLALESLLGRKPTKRLNLGEIERALVARNVGDDLYGALTRLGHPPSQEAAQRRAARTRSDAARATLTSAVASWDEPWATEWSDRIVRAGLLSDLDSDAADTLIADVRLLLDHLDDLEPPGTGRTELAAALFGSAHALDQGTKRSTAVTHALRYRVGALEGRELWEAAGILWDSVSAPALMWSLPVVGASALDEQIRAASSGRLPLHVSLFAMQRHPVTVPRGTCVLVVENPRLVEAAAERNLPGCVVTSNGNPSTAVTTLLRQLQRSGASIWYHGDFDAPGIAICRRMHENGYTPWMMDAPDYEDAVRLAERNGVRLELDPNDCGTTPWDRTLQAVFRRRRLIVHEEFVLDGILDEFNRGRTLSSPSVGGGSQGPSSAAGTTAIPSRSR